MGVETGTASCFAPLAADRLRRQPFARPTSPHKTRVRGFYGCSSGRFSSQRRRIRRIATGCGPCGYKTVSGRSKWVNRDPLEERGGLNLYAFALNEPTVLIDNLGLSSACGAACEAAFNACMLDNFTLGLAGGVGSSGFSGLARGGFRTPTGLPKRLCTIFGRGVLLDGLGGFGIGFTLGSVPCWAAYMGCLSGCPPTPPTPIWPYGGPVNAPPVLPPITIPMPTGRLQY